MSSSIPPHHQHRKAFANKVAPLVEIATPHDDDKNIAITSASKLPLSNTTNTEHFKPLSFHSKPEKLVQSAEKRESALQRRPRLDNFKSKKAGLLRYGERLEDLFGIAHSTPWDNDYYKKCRKLYSLEENASPDQPNDEERCQLWWDILKSAPQQSTLCETSLLRLHRRATTRLQWSNTEIKSSYLLDIWLSYARVQMENGALSDAQLTLRHLRAEREAAYHVALADLDEKMGKSKADSIKQLQSAVDHGAQPVVLLHEALGKRGVHAHLSVKREQEEDENIPPKRMKTLAPISDSCSPKKSISNTEGDCNALDDSNMSLDEEEEETNGNSDTIKWKTTVKVTNDVRIDTDLPKKTSCSIGSTYHDDKTAEVSNKPCEIRASATPCRSQETRIPSTEAPKYTSTRMSDAKKTPVSTGITLSKLPNSHSIASRQRRPLIGKLPRLTRLSGKAQRVDPNQSAVLEELDDSLDEITKESPIATVSSSGSSKNPSKPFVSKMDLSYIFEWDPNRRFNEQRKSSDQQEPGSAVSTDSTSSHHADRDKDDSENRKDSTLSSVQNEPIRQEINTVEEKLPENSDFKPPEEPQKIETQSRRRNAHVQSKIPPEINPDFLPLASEKNIIRVNGSPYAKLGVIGKGGSCKVYRALSKDCSVVAIKRVKTEGLDRSAIESYANEIRLLQSLRGNAAIIQMFDSQVDLKRKSIFVVMEVGEVDLNHVLQKQSLLVDGAEGVKRLNMNFVRLTWFQMLTAVHCIHEARIIHGDLKPANFLFVRGALKLIDFGIAKAMQNEDTTNIYRDSQIGTLNYMSPEALLESDGDPNKPKHKLGRVSVNQWICDFVFHLHYLTHSLT